MMPTIRNIAFDSTVHDHEMDQMEKSERVHMLMEVGSRVGSLLLVAAALFLLVRWVRRSTLFSPPAQESQLSAGASVAALLPPVETEPLKDKIVELARNRPEDVSRLLRIWLREEDK